MLQQNFQSDKAQYHAAGQGGPALEPAAEAVADPYAGQGEDEGGTADESNRREDGHLQKGKGDAHRQGVDAGGHRQHQQLFEIKAGRAGVRPLMEGVPYHFAADVPQQAEGDPVVHGDDVALKLPAQGPAGQGHGRLEAAKEQGDDPALPPAHPLHAQPPADGHREGVHAQAHADEKQL